MSLSTALLRLADRSGKPLTNGARLIGTRYYGGTDFLASAQGVTNDGRFYYCTGTVLPLGFHGLSKIEMKNGRVAAKRKNYLPPELAAVGVNHYGGCTYFENGIYVAAEAGGRPPCIAVFSAETLAFTGRFRTYGPEIQPEGNLPWVAADKKNRLLYTGFFNHCDRINVFDADSLEYLRSVPLDRTVEHTQGGEMWDGLIYISCHDSWRKKHIYSIDPAAGAVRTVMERDASRNLVESEGITIRPMPDGSFFHQLDVVYPLGLAVRRYAAPSGVRLTED